MAWPDGAWATRTCGQLNPRIVFCTISGYGMTGPYQNLPAHGVAFDTWAGIVTPQVDDDGFAYLPEHASMGIHAGPLFGALGILAAVIRARTTGEGSFLEIAQSDAAAAMDWYRSETWRAYERPESEVTGNKADNYERREPGTAGMVEGVRYQVYEAKDGRYRSVHGLGAGASGRTSARSWAAPTCSSGGRGPSTPTTPGATSSCGPSCRDIFRTRTAGEWIESGTTANFPVAPVNSPKTIAEDPQFQDRFTWYPVDQLGAEQLGTPLKFVGEELPAPSHAPTVGQHTDEVLRDLLGWDDARIAESRARGGLGGGVTSRRRPGSSPVGRPPRAPQRPTSRVGHDQDRQEGGRARNNQFLSAAGCPPDIDPAVDADLFSSRHGLPPGHLIRHVRGPTRPR